MTRPHNRARSLPRSPRTCRTVEALERRVLLSETVSLVKDINTTPRSGPVFPENFYEADGKVFFSALESGMGRELAVTDGTRLGTHYLGDINPSGSSSPAPVAHLNGTFYF